MRIRVIAGPLVIDMPLLNAALVGCEFNAERTACGQKYAVAIADGCIELEWRGKGTASILLETTLNSYKGEEITDETGDHLLFPIECCEEIIDAATPGGAE